MSDSDHTHILLPKCKICGVGALKKMGKGYVCQMCGGYIPNI